MFKFIFSLLKTLFLTALGTALAAKFLLESNAEPETQEIDLVSIFEGHHLVSSAAPFYGGRLLTIFGGVRLDLRKAQPAPTGIMLDIGVLLGGVSIVVPEGWRVIYEGDIYLGGWSDETHTTADDEVPTVTITGFVALGGLNATTRSPVEAVA